MRSRARRLIVGIALASAGHFPFSAFAGEPKLPDFLPARGELPPTYWEEHGWMIAIVSLVVLALLALLVVWLSRPAPAATIPPGLVARRALEALRSQPEDGALLMRVSGIVRHYVMLACGLPPRERTTAELSRDLEAHPQLNGDLAGSITGFLRRCDERKFAPAPAPSPPSAVATALDLISRVETQNQQISRVVPPQPSASSVAAAPS